MRRRAVPGEASQLDDQIADWEAAKQAAIAANDFALAGALHSKIEEAQEAGGGAGGRAYEEEAEDLHGRHPQSPQSYEEQEEQEEPEERQLSIYFPDKLVRKVMKGGEDMTGGPVSFIEAEQALLSSDADVKGALELIQARREKTKSKQGTRGGFGGGNFTSSEYGGSEMGGGLSCMATIAGAVILIMIVLSMLVVALVDGVIEVPGWLRDTLHVALPSGGRTTHRGTDDGFDDSFD